MRHRRLARTRPADRSEPATRAHRSDGALCGMSVRRVFPTQRSGPALSVNRVTWTHTE